MQTSPEVVVIGGGPAGASCAIWLHKLGVAVRLYEASDALGGLQTLSPYENLWLPGVQGKTGQQVAADLSQHVRDLSIDARTGVRAAVERVDGGYRIDGVTVPFVVIATGSRPRSGGFTPSATVAIGPGTPMEALDVAGKRVAIMGGGDNAFDQARFVRERGGEVTVFSRTPPRAQKLLQDVDAHVVVGPYEARQDTMTIHGERFDAWGVMYGFEAVVPEGLRPALDKGYVVVDRYGATSLPDVYACGEVTDYWHPCVTTACAHGIQVAKQISLRLAR